MKFKYILSFLLFVQIIYSQNIDELIQPKCDGKNIYYSIVGNMKDYIENDNNLDNREIYRNISDLKTKKIGVLKGSNYNTTFFNNVTIYGNIDELLYDLRKNKLDAIIMDLSFNNYIQAFDLVGFKCGNKLCRNE